MFDLPFVLIKQVSDQPEYEIEDANKHVVGRVVRTEGPPRPQGIRGAIAEAVASPDPGRVVIQATGLDGTPAFSVVRDTGRLDILGPDGALIGTVESDQDATGAEVRRVSGSAFGSVLRLVGIGKAVPRVFHLLRDASGQRVCGICWEQKQHGQGGGTVWVPTNADYTDVNGVRIAQLNYHRATKAEYTLKIEYRLSEPLRTLVLASVLAFALVRS